MKKYKLILLTSLTLFVGITYAQTKDTLSIYPNPFSSQATIEFEVVQSDTITLKVFDNLGQTVRTFFESVLFPIGSYKVNALGDNFGDGIYFVQLTIGTKKSMFQKVIKSGSTTNIANNLPNNSIRVYPNPTSDTLNIPIDGNKTIIITDRTGLTVKTITTDQNVISLKDLANGLYYVAVLNDKKEVLLSEKIVKM